MNAHIGQPRGSVSPGPPSPGAGSPGPAGGVAVAPERVHEVLGRHVLADGFRLVYDTRASHGSWLVDARSGEKYLDLYTFFASAPLGSNPRGLADDPVIQAGDHLLIAEAVEPEHAHAHRR